MFPLQSTINLIYLNLVAMKKYVILGILAFIALSICILIYISHTTMPFNRDDQGNTHGTGIEEIFYPNGQVKISTEYITGDPVITLWYHPDGSIAYKTEWDDGRGMWYWLDDNGILKAKCNMKNDMAHGLMTYYNPEGTVIKEVVMEEGVAVED